MCLCLCVNNTNLHSKICVSKTKVYFTYACMHFRTYPGVHTRTHTSLNRTHFHSYFNMNLCPRRVLLSCSLNTCMRLYMQILIFYLLVFTYTDDLLYTYSIELNIVVYIRQQSEAAQTTHDAHMSE